MLLVDAGIVNL